MIKITAIGDCGIDYYVNQKKSLVGGIAFNFISNCQELGGKCSLISCIGSNEKEQIIKVIDSKKINNTLLKIKLGNSALQKISILNDGSRKFVGYKKGVLKEFQLTEKDKSFLVMQDIIFCPLSDGIEHIFEEIAQLDIKGIKVADFSIDHKKFSLNKLENYVGKFEISFLGGTKEMVDEILPLFKGSENIIVITMVKDGSVALKNGEKIFQEIIPIKVVDTTGCGDAFQAAFVMEYVKTKNIASALLSGAQHAAKIAQHLGGIKQ